MNNDTFEEESRSDKYIKECSYSQRKHEEIENRFSGLINKKPYVFDSSAKRKKARSKRPSVESLEESQPSDENHTEVNYIYRTATVEKTHPKEKQENPQQEEKVQEISLSEEQESNLLPKEEVQNREESTIVEIEEAEENPKEEQPLETSGIEVASDVKEERSEHDYQAQVDAFLDSVYEKKEESSSTQKTWFSKIMGAIVAGILMILCIMILSFMWPNSVGAFLSKLGIPVTAPVSGDPISGEDDNGENGISSGAIEGSGGLNDDRLIAKEDKSELIGQIAVDYPLIESLKYNGNLKYIDGNAYTIQGLENSVPLTDNVWYEVNGEKVYYDESLIRCIAQFNSLWCDYINGGDRSVFQLINLEGKAATDALGFNHKNLKEAFQLLEIGEIRRIDDVFYVWTHEKINATRNGKTQLMEYHWIYTVIMRGNNPIIDGYSIDGYYKY